MTNDAGASCFEFVFGCKKGRRSTMTCARCGGLVEWRALETLNPYKKCLKCGWVNARIMESEEDEEESDDAESE
jgi:endogenous inhibitor of DNA gyrase (YacG/DUF329 family)